MVPIDILILTASFGNGHNAATKAIIESLNHTHPTMQVASRDLFEITAPALKNPLSITYDYLTRSRMPLYNPLYRVRNFKDYSLDDLMLFLYYSRFKKIIDALKPKVIISVFPTCAQFAAHYKDSRCPSLKTITVITDVTSSWEWIHEQTDLYCVPAVEVKAGLQSKGIPSDKILITGVPVSSAFKKVNDTLSDMSIEDQKHILIMGSSMGKIKLNQEALDQFGNLPHTFTIVTGKDEDLYSKLTSLSVPSNTTVLGFTKEIPSLMKSSHLLVTKPGGATLFEAIQCELPLLIQSSKIGQETYNVDFVTRHDIGETFASSSEMIPKLLSVINNTERLKSLQSNMIKFKESYQIKELNSLLETWLSQSQHAYAYMDEKQHITAMRLKQLGKKIRKQNKQTEADNEARRLSQIIKTFRIANRK